MDILKKITKVKDAFVETLEEQPEMLGKIAWAGGLTLLVVYQQLSLWQIGNEVSNLKGTAAVHTMELDLIEKAMDHNTKQFISYRILNQNNDHACIAMLDFLGDKLGVKEEMAAAGKAASDLYLSEMNIDPDKLLSVLAEAPARVTSF